MNETYAYAEALQKLFAEVKKPDKEYDTFLKVDISGIQDYIFHVQSEKAARTLKGRSFLVQALGWLAEENIRAAVNEDCYTIYNGGGNVYMLVNTNDALGHLEFILNEKLWPFQLYLCISTVAYTPNHFKDCKRALEQQSAKDKQRKYRGQWQAFKAFEFERDQPSSTEKDQTDRWNVLTKKLVKNRHYTLSPVESQQAVLVTTKGRIQLGAYQLELKEAAEPKLAGSMLANLPTWDEALLKQDKLKELVEKEYQRQAQREGIIGDREKVEGGQILEFSALAALSGQRTGTPKLGILKMDVDNLGKVFGDLPTVEAMSYLSEAFKWFFEYRFCAIWREDFSYTSHARDSSGSYKPRSAKAPFCHNLYVVFAGGDDCFVVGGWDACLAFAQRVRDDFSQFMKTLQAQAQTDFLAGRVVTLSAGVELVSPKYPTILFARAANEAIDKAKDYEKERGQLNAKNRVTLFDEALSWKNYRQSRESAGQLSAMISGKLFNRSLLHRIQRSSKGFQELPHPSAQHKAKVELPEEWHLYHFLGRMRNTRSKKKEQAWQEVDGLMKTYAKALLQAHLDKGGNTHMTYPLAARLAEFSTRTAKLSFDEQ